MGRPWRGKTGRKLTGKPIHKQQGKVTSNINVDTSLEELDDDIDKFHKGSDKIPLDVNKDSDLSEYEAEDPIFNLKGESSEEEDAMESEDEDLDEEKLSGLAAKMAKQAKILKQKSSLMEDDEGEEQDGNEKKALWGKRKRAYYSADNVDYELQSSDEDALAEEEAEALRLQRLQAESLCPEDFELEEEDDAAPSLEVHENTMQELVESQEAEDDQERGHDSSKRCRFDGFAKGAKMLVEEVKKDLNALSKEEQMEVVMSDAPELVGLLAELREGLDELQTKVEPLLIKVKGEHLANKDGISFLESKHILLLCYCQSIVFYLLMKAEGRSVWDHPVIARLVEIRMLLDKLQPIDIKLHNQVGKLMSLVKEPFLMDGIKEHLGEADELNHEQSAELGLKMDQVEGENKIVLTVPTVKSSAVLIGDDTQVRIPKYYAEDSKRSAPENGFRSRLGKDLEDEFEKTMQVTVPESKEMLRERARLDSRLKDNLEVFENGLLLKSGQQKLNQMNRLGNGLTNRLDDFDDEIADFVVMNEYKVGGKLIRDISRPRKLSQIIAEAGHQSKKTKIVSGDADLPGKENLGERRAKLEMQKAFKADYGEDEPEEQHDAPLEEDEFYQKAKQKKAAKQAAKELKYARIPNAAPVVEEESGKRHISYQMEKNKGLTPHRKKLTKNPRKKYKVKHQKALVRRKGQVREVKLPTGPYGGEATGIRSNISRSVRFHS